MEKPFRTYPKRDKNILTLPDRIGELVGIFFVLLVTAFFAYHYSVNTGFMTAKFGIMGAIFMFGSAALSVIASGARAIIGRRDSARPFELVSAVYWTITALWFLYVFPFNFVHFADPLPSSIEFIASWISDPIGRIIILLTVIGGVATSIYTAIRIILDRMNF